MLESRFRVTLLPEILDSQIASDSKDVVRNNNLCQYLRYMYDIYDIPRPIDLQNPIDLSAISDINLWPTSKLKSSISSENKYQHLSYDGRFLCLRSFFFHGSRCCESILRRRCIWIMCGDHLHRKSARCLQWLCSTTNLHNTVPRPSKRWPWNN